MTLQPTLVAVDLGAESCRVSLLHWHGDEPRITLVHRFLNGPVTLSDGTLRWPLDTILTGVEHGLRLAAAHTSAPIAAIAVDGWAVDYVRLNASGQPLASPFCYRDPRTLAAEASLHARITPERLNALTGIRSLRINTLYQLHADRLAAADPGAIWLNLPEFVLAHLGGRRVSEHTNAGHTQLVDVHTQQWSPEIFAAAGLELANAPPLVAAGTDLGPLTGPLAQLSAFASTRLIAPACHDTASAIAGIPTSGDDWAYISSGTWSLVGAMLPQPNLTTAAAAAGFTNLAAAGGYTCFHVNVNGMWMLSQCLAEWGARAPDVPTLVAAAEREPTSSLLLDVDDPALHLPGNMLASINAQLIARGAAPLSTAPAAAPAVASLLFHSLAERYRQVLTALPAHTGHALRRVFIVGGGSRNTFLNRLIAQSTGLEVHTGSPESSTLGNFAVQLAQLEASAPPTAERIAYHAQRLQHAVIQSLP